MGTRVAEWISPVRGSDIGPPQPGLLADVLGVGRRAEHLVGDGEEQAAVGDERVVGHAVEATASGLRSHAAANSCDSMPNAVLERVSSADLFGPKPKPRAGSGAAARSGAGLLVGSPRG